MHSPGVKRLLARGGTTVLLLLLVAGGTWWAVHDVPRPLDSGGATTTRIDGGGVGRGLERRADAEPDGATASPVAPRDSIVGEVVLTGRARAADEVTLHLLRGVHGATLLATHRVAPGPFRLPLPSAEPGALTVVASRFGRQAASAVLPDGVGDCGRLVLRAGLAYGGQVVDGNGAPVIGARVELWSGDERSGRRWGVAPATDEAGAFAIAFDGDPPAFHPTADGTLHGLRVRVVVDAAEHELVPATTAGLTGEHRVVAAGRLRSFSIRFLEADGTTPISGLRVTWRPRGGQVGRERYLSPFSEGRVTETGTTDERGEIRVNWPPSTESAFVDFEREGRRHVAWLEARYYGGGTGERDVFLVTLEDTTRLDVEVHDETKRPAPGWSFLLSTSYGALTGVTDAGGRCRWTLVHVYDQTHFRVDAHFWEAHRRGAKARFVRREIPSDRRELADGDVIVADVAEGRIDAGTWFELRGPGAAPLTDVFGLRSSHVLASWPSPSGAGTVWLVRGAVDTFPEGRGCWCELPCDHPPEDTASVDLELRFDGRLPHHVRLARDRLVAAADHARRIVVEVPPEDAATVRIRLSSPDGSAAARGRVLLEPRERGRAETRHVSVDAAGVVELTGLCPNVVYEGVAHDAAGVASARFEVTPASGAASEVAVRLRE